MHHMDTVFGTKGMNCENWFPQLAFWPGSGSIFVEMHPKFGCAFSLNIFYFHSSKHYRYTQDVITSFRMEAYRYLKNYSPVNVLRLCI